MSRALNANSTSEQDSSTINIPATRIWRLSDFFSFKPAMYVADPKHTDSDRTRRPAFYDMHLSEPLQLKRVMISANFTQTLATICDRMILPELSSLNNLNISDIMHNTHHSRAKIVSEKGLADDYLPRTAIPCQLIASTIAFGTSAGFQWQQTETKKDPALCDGILTVQAMDTWATSPHPKQRDAAVDIKLIRKYKLENLLLLEFKSLVAAPLDVMEAILRLANGQGDFTWMTCGSKAHGRVQKCDEKPRRSRHAKDGIETVTGTSRETGPDARHAWWDPPAEAGNKRRHPEAFPPDLTNTRTGIVFQGASEKTYFMKACDIIQQVWAELVKLDATFAIISSGNHEIILRRHRESCTLHLSNIIRPSEDTEIAHYKLHTAVYIAAYLDSVDRARQLNTGSSADIGVQGGTRNARVVKVKQTKKQKEVIFEKFLSQLTALNKIMMLPSEIVRANSVPLTFRRQFLYSRSELQQVILDFQEKFVAQTALEALGVECDSEKVQFQIDIASPLRRLGDKTWLGAVTREKLLDQSEEAYYFNGIVVKLATTESQKTRLLNEYNMYVLSTQIKLAKEAKAEGRKKSESEEKTDAVGIKMQARKQARKKASKAPSFPTANSPVTTSTDDPNSDSEAPSIPFALHTFGWFTCISAGFQCDMLLIEKGGESIRQILEQPGFSSSPAIREKHRLGVIAAADALHDLDFLHNDLRVEHVVYDKQPRRYTLISFAEASSMQQEREKAHSKKDRIDDRRALVQAFDSAI